MIPDRSGVTQTACPHCQRADYRWRGEVWVPQQVGPSIKGERCSYCMPLRMDAYYFGFAPTGVLEVDRILSAVAYAGKGYHHTDGWGDETGDFGPFHGGSYVAWIQNAAEEAAEALRAALQKAEGER